ncbi:uncharacterized protein LOC141640707 [Silene latifolia]|uniref:uncharacterized protein LOC141640707 n=1 Tax=Silene latifolia TaxID=37657 RepID=UPI003D786DD2
MANFAKETQQEQANLRANFLKYMREMESRMASHAMANPQRPPGGLLAQGQSSKDASNSHHAHAVVLRSGVELEDPYKDLALEVDEDLKGNELEMDGEEESSPIEASGKASEDKKGKKACEDLSRRGIQVDKDVDGYVEDLTYEEEAIEEVPLPHSKKVTKSSAPPKVSSNSQLVSKIPYPSRAIKSRENLKVLGDQEIVAMEETCSAHILNTLPTKLGDPGSFSIPCVVGGVPISRALCDLGASVSVIPLKVAKRIGIQNLAPTTMTLQLADRSVKRPMGVLEDIPVKVVHEVAREEAEMEEVFQISLHDEAMKENHEVDEELLKKVEGFLPPKVQLKSLPPSLKYSFLDEGEAFPVIINANLKKSMEVFMDDFSVHGDSFDHGLENLTNVLKRCEEHNLVLNWEKCHFMVEEGVVLGHIVSSKGIEVDGAKVDVIENLSPPSNVKGVRSFLGHAGFYRRFIKDFSKIAKPLTSLLLKDATFVFDEFCLEAFHRLKNALVTAPIIRAPDWSLPFEIMCDASDFAVRAVLGQVVDRKHHVIYYTSKTLDPTQCGYATTEKEMLAIVHAIEKFRQYLVGSKDKAGSENVIADHLSRLTVEDHGIQDKSGPINEWLRDDGLMEVSIKTPWFADLANYIVSGFLPDEMEQRERRKLRNDAKRYFWNDPHLFRKCGDGMFRRCVSREEGLEIVDRVHNSPMGDTWPPLGPLPRSSKVDFIGPPCSKTSTTWLNLVMLAKGLGTLGRGVKCP